MGLRLILALFLLSVPTTAAAADTSAPNQLCGSRADVLKALSDSFHEKQSAVGLTSAGTLLEVLTSDNGATWTIIVSRPDGFTCVVAAGTSWQDKTGGAI